MKNTTSKLGTTFIPLAYGRVSEQIKPAVTLLTFRPYLLSTGIEYPLEPCPIWQRCGLSVYYISIVY